MQSKLNFYDFAGYIIPGFLLMLFLWWFLLSCFYISLDIKIESIQESIVVIVVVYLLGHIIQIFGRRFEDKLMRVDGIWFSERYLSDSDECFTPYFKSELRKAMESVFGKPTYVGNNDNNHKKRRKELFNLCISLIAQGKADSLSQIYLGICGLFRGIYVTIGIGIFTGIIIIVKELLVLFFPLISTSIPIHTFSSLQLGIDIVIFASLLFLKNPIRERFIYFSEKYAESVYYSFYSWYTENKLS
jgi:hypothetical protein